jgi:hypothetical protein
MKIRADHRIEFVVDDGTEIPPVLDPSYIYKEGEVIKFYDVLTSSETKNVLGTFKVNDVVYELHDVATSEQVIIIYLSRIEA